jgi:hypothetical protein
MFKAAAAELERSGVDLATKPVRTHLLCLPLALQSASVLPALPSLVAC